MRLIPATVLPDVMRTPPSANATSRQRAKRKLDQLLPAVKRTAKCMNRGPVIAGTGSGLEMVRPEPAPCNRNSAGRPATARHAW